MKTVLQAISHAITAPQTDLLQTLLLPPTYFSTVYSTGGRGLMTL